MPQASVLVVDDNTNNLYLLLNMLTKAGYRVRASTNGQQALETAQVELPDLILLDIIMPGMSGYEVCEAFKADEHTRDIPIIFISGLGDVDDKIRAFEVGGVDYVSKPFKQGEVLARVATHLALRALHKKLEAEQCQLQREIAAHQAAQARILEQQRQLAMLEERERIGQDLHDDLGQVSAYTTMQAQSALALLERGQQDKAEEALAQLVQSTQEVQKGLRNYILGIRANAQAIDFFAALNAYLDILHQRYGLTVQVCLPDNPPAQPFAPDAEAQILRITQEALTNVAQHAGVNRAQVRIEFDSQDVVVTVEDQGQGFDPAAYAPDRSGDPTPSSRLHFGLQTMRERAASIGGSLELHSAPGEGTRVIVRVPHAFASGKPRAGLKPAC